MRGTRLIARDAAAGTAAGLATMVAGGPATLAVAMGVAVGAIASSSSMIGCFTPVQAAMGGLLLGIATVAQLLLTGRVLGISGTIKGTILQWPEHWKPAITLGMLLASIPLAVYLPSCFTVLPSSYTTERALIGGLLVGIGTGMGNGCTSGHSICGNARGNERSMFYTITFMVTGAMAATLTNAAAAAGAPTLASLPLVHPSDATLRVSLGLVAAAASVFLLIGKAGYRASAATKASLEGITSLLVGATFATGLALSGMTLPAKVLGFLSPTIPAWDPSLAFVLAAALAVATLGYQSVLGRLPLLPERMRVAGPPAGMVGKPVLVDGYCLPMLFQIDSKLLMGGTLFGIGWGMSGMCPGPALVAFGGSVALKLQDALAGLPLDAPCLCAKTGIYLASMLAGMLIQERILKN